MLKYRTSAHSLEIDGFEVERETEKCIWIDGGRLSKETDYERWHDTYDEALTALYCRATNRVDSRRRAFIKALGELEYVKEMEKEKARSAPDVPTPSGPITTVPRHD